MELDKIYLVFCDRYCYHEGNDDGPPGGKIDKIFKSKQKAIDYVISKTGQTPDEDNRVRVDLYGKNTGYDEELYTIVELPLITED